MAKTAETVEQQIHSELKTLNVSMNAILQAMLAVNRTLQEIHSKIK